MLEIWGILEFNKSNSQKSPGNMLAYEGETEVEQVSVIDYACSHVELTNRSTGQASYLSKNKSQPCRGKKPRHKSSKLSV